MPSPGEPLPVISGAVAVLGTGACAAAVRWSQWWPHADNRQNVMTLVMAVSGLIALVALLTACARLSARLQTVLLLVVVAAGALGWFVGFEVLTGSTETYK